MSDPIHSSEWTGDTNYPSYRRGQTSVSDQYQQILRAQQEFDALPPQVRALRRMAAWLLVSPLALWIAYYVVRTIIPDGITGNPSGPLAAWTCVAMAIATWQFQSTSRKYLELRRRALVAGLVATVGASFLYGYLATTSYADARPSARERAFEFFRCSGRCRFGGYYLHQRADGTTLEGERLGPAVPYGTTCTVVQRLSGDYGFGWVRVLERSPPNKRELQWPIRRGDCFSDKPIQSLSG
jgi:hypothetical protein